jgi:DNA-binding MarR family transcriptional regulator
MHLIETQRAKAWLNQFEPSDIETARLLLTSLDCVSNSRFRESMRRLLESVASCVGHRMPVYIARDPNSDGRYFHNKREKPNVLGSKQKIGSTGVVGNMLDLLTRIEPHLFCLHPPIAALKRYRYNDIIILDDCSISGGRIGKFLKSFRRSSKSIGSWWSYGLLRFHVTTFAMTKESEKNILGRFRRRPRLKTSIIFHRVQRPTKLCDLLSGKQFEALKRLCRKYSRLHKIRNKFGYAESMSSLVFEHSCPNNNPGILWDPTPTWNPLFPNRGVDPKIGSTFNAATPPWDDGKLLSKMVGRKTIQSGILGHLNPSEMRTLMVLIAIKKKLRQKNRIAEFTRIDEQMVVAIVNRLVARGLVSDHYQLTEMGRSELENITRYRSRLFEPPPKTDKFYFPTNLREASDESRTPRHQ